MQGLLFIFLLTPVSFSQYFSIPLTGFFVSDWRVGQFLSPFPIVVSIEGTPIEIPFDPSVLPLFPFERINYSIKEVSLSPKYFDGKEPETFLFSERGSSKYSNIGISFGRWIGRRSSINLFFDYSSLYLERENTPKGLSYSIAYKSEGDWSMKFFLIRAKRSVQDGFYLQGEDFLFLKVRTYRKNLEIGASFSKRPKLLENSLSYTAYLSLSKILKLELRSEEEKYKDERANVSLHLRRKFLLIEPGLSFSRKFGFFPYLNLRGRKSLLLFNLTSFPRIPPPYFNLKKENVEKGLEISVDFGRRDVAFLEAYFLLKKNLIFNELDKISQMEGEGHLFFIKGGIGRSFGRFSLHYQALFSSKSNCIPFLRKTDHILKIENSFSIQQKIDIKLRGVGYYIGEATSHNSILTGDIEIRVIFFNSVFASLRIRNVFSQQMTVRNKIPPPLRTYQTGIYVFLKD